MQDKDATLAAIFGDRYAAATNTTSINLTAEEPKKASPESVSETPSGYDVLAEKICGLEKKSHRGGETNEMLAWVKARRPVAICVISNDLIEDLSNELRRDAIPFIRLQRVNNTLFVAKDEDKARFDDSLTNTLYRICGPTKILNYETFIRTCEEGNFQKFFLKNLTELQMESIRRNMDLHHYRKEYTFFRTNDGQYGMGFKADDMVGIYPTTSPDAFKKCFLESYLASSLLMSGEQSDFYQDILADDVECDKESASFFSETLAENNRPIFVYNPLYPEKAIKVMPGEFCPARGIDIEGYWDVETGKKLAMYSQNGMYFYRRAMLAMLHKKKAFSKKEYIEAVKGWINGERIRQAKEEVLIAGKKAIANIIYDDFSFTFEDEPWLSDQLKIEVQLGRFKEHVLPTLDALKHGKYPRQLSAGDANAVLGIIARTDAYPDTFAGAFSAIESLSIVKDIALDEQRGDAETFRKQLSVLSQRTDSAR